MNDETGDWGNELGAYTVAHNNPGRVLKCASGLWEVKQFGIIKGTSL